MDHCDLYYLFCWGLLYMVHQICWPLATQIYANRNRRTHNSTVQPRLVPWHYKETNIAPKIRFSPGANRKGKSLYICVAVHEYPHDVYIFIPIHICSFIMFQHQEFPQCPPSRVHPKKRNDSAPRNQSDQDSGWTSNKCPRSNLRCT